jgi:hypothetical protein
VRTIASRARFTFYAFNLDGSAGRPGLRDQLLQCSRHGAGALALYEAGRVRTRDEDEVVTTGEPLVERPECFSEPALHRIPLYGASDLAAHRDPEANLLAIIIRVAAREGVEDQEAVGMGPPFAIDAIEIAAARQAATPTPLAGRHGVSRLRPLRRRRLMIWRPLRVRMRARNPCVRARLRFLGW